LSRITPQYIADWADWVDEVMAVPGDDPLKSWTVFRSHCWLGDCGSKAAYAAMHKFYWYFKSALPEFECKSCDVAWRHEQSDKECENISGSDEANAWLTDILGATPESNLYLTAWCTWE
jgi:hypothetical protein